MKSIAGRKKIGFLILVLALVGGIAVFYRSNADRDMMEAKASELIDKDNRPVNFADFAGKVVVINNWASWCPPCVAEMPSIQKLKEKVKGEDIIFVMVSFDEDPAKAQRFMAKKGYDLEVYFPGKKYPYATSSIPVTFVLDRKGKVVLRHEGMFDYSNDKFFNQLGKLME